VNISEELQAGGPCVAAVVFAVAIEADAFERLTTGQITLKVSGLVLHEAMLGDVRVAWCVGGVGRERAARAAGLLVDGHRPRSLVAAGFAGGLDPGLPRGSLVCPAAVRGLAGEVALPLIGQGGPLAVTVDRIVRTAAEKRSLAEATGAAIVDMETLAVAAVAREAGLPCRAVRIVSDAAGDELPADLGRLLEPQAATRQFGTLLGMLGRRPRAALELWQLWERAVVDGRRLAAALAEVCRSLAAARG